MGAKNPDRRTVIDTSDYNCYFETNGFGHYPNRDRVYYYSVDDWTVGTGGLDANSKTVNADPLNDVFMTIKNDSECWAAVYNN